MHIRGCEPLPLPYSQGGWGKKYKRTDGWGKAGGNQGSKDWQVSVTGGGAECGLEEHATSLRERAGVGTDWLVHSLRKLRLAPVTELARGSKAHR